MSAIERADRQVRAVPCLPDLGRLSAKGSLSPQSKPRTELTHVTEVRTGTP